MGQTSFVIASNGFVDSPAQALRDYLVDRGARSVKVILHPLLPDEAPMHEITEWRSGEMFKRRRIRLPSRPPLTFLFDSVVPPVPPRADYWFGFNCLTASVGLTARRMGRVGKVVYWCIDYVDNRFGANPLTSAYEALDGVCCRRADARFELSKEALDARTGRHSGDGRVLAPAYVVPMGAWTERTPTAGPDSWGRRRIVFMGHLVPMQGVAALVDALAIVRAHGLDATLDVIGRGPELESLKTKAAAAGTEGAVTFHGFVERHTDLERILADSSVAVAPYDPGVETFKRFADPGKIKSYLAAGLPIVMTDVPHNAVALEAEGCARVVAFSPAAIAAALEHIFGRRDVWESMRKASMQVAKTFDWNTIIAGALETVGIA